MSSNSFTWIECKKWLDKCRVIPNSLKMKLNDDCLNIDVFSNYLRDGIILCNLFSHISSQDHSSDIIWPGTSRITCLINIRMFLENCKKEFHLTDKSLFQAEMLYDLTNMEFVFHALSKISKIKSVEKKSGHRGFDVNLNEPHGIYDNIQANNENIPINNVIENPYSHVNDLVSGYENIYREIMRLELTNEERLSTDSTELSDKDYAIKEIFESETKFVKLLKIIHEDFMIHLNPPILKDSDQKDIFINIESIKNLHIELLKKLRGALEGKEGRSHRICQVFDSFQFRLMQEYVDYFIGLNKSKNRLNKLISNNPEFKTQLDWCRKQSIYKEYRLSDLILAPFQRILKYHLLFSQLNKHVHDDHPSKIYIEKTLCTMLHIPDYLNESFRQNEIINQMKALNGVLQGISKKIELTNFGELIIAAKIQIKENSNQTFSKSRTILLLNKVLFICKSIRNNLVYKGAMMINDCKFEEIHSTKLNLFSNDKVYSLYFKNVQEKNDWKRKLENAIDSLKPEGFTNNNHRFVLYNFERDIVICSICQNILIGIFYQGYKCINCGCIAHKQCLSKFEKTCIPKLNDSMYIQSTIIDSKERPAVFVSYKVKATFSYQGKPKPIHKEHLPLTFNAGDVIQVTDDDDDDWWKGYKITDDDHEEGYFPSNSVQVIQNDDPSEKESITNQLYFFNYDKSESERVLNNLKNDFDKTIFIVRPSSKIGSYTITIKNQSNIYHSRILSTSSNKLTLDDILEFSTLQELIDHYMTHKFDYFSKKLNLNTTLGIPYTNALELEMDQPIENEKWYSNQKSEIAIKILNALEEEINKSVFLVRPRKSGGYKISIKFKSEIEHIPILETTDYDETQKFFIEENLKFNSIKQLIFYYIEKSSPKLPTTLDIPFRNALPKPIETRKALFDYQKVMNDELDIQKDQDYCVISKNHDMWRIYNSDGLVAFAPKICFEK